MCCERQKIKVNKWQHLAAIFWYFWYVMISLLCDQCTKHVQCVVVCCYFCLCILENDLIIVYWKTYIYTIYTYILYIYLLYIYSIYILYIYTIYIYYIYTIYIYYIYIHIYIYLKYCIIFYYISLCMLRIKNLLVLFAFTALKCCHCFFVFLDLANLVYSSLFWACY